MTNYVLGFMFDPDKEKVLLIKKINPPWQAGLLNGVGGKIEDGEENEFAMSREFEEETGIQTTPEQWEYCIFHYRFVTDKFRLFVYKTIGNIYAAQYVEKEKPIVVDVLNLPDTIIPNLKWIIPTLLNEEIDFPIAVPCK